MANCPPCRTIAPIFSKMLTDIIANSNYQKACPVPNLVAVKIDIHQCDPLIPQYYGVTATPTFVYIKNGKEMARIVGANRNEIERRMNEMITEAQNSKPCIKINMQNRFIPLQYNTFEQIDNFATVITNLKSSLLSSNKIDQVEWDSLMTVKYHINNTPDPNNTISDSCLNIIQKSIDLLDENDVTPLLEIIKKLFLNSKVKEHLITKKDIIISKLIKKFSGNLNIDINTLILKILCNWCNELDAVKPTPFCFSITNGVNSFYFSVKTEPDFQRWIDEFTTRIRAFQRVGVVVVDSSDDDDESSAMGKKKEKKKVKKMKQAMKDRNH